MDGAGEVVGERALASREQINPWQEGGKAEGERDKERREARFGLGEVWRGVPVISALCKHWQEGLCKFKAILGVHSKTLSQKSL